jgi:hypothetical protein
MIDCRVQVNTLLDAGFAGSSIVTAILTSPFEKRLSSDNSARFAFVGREKIGRPGGPAIR